MWALGHPPFALPPLSVYRVSFTSHVFPTFCPHVPHVSPTCHPRLTHVSPTSRPHLTHVISHVSLTSSPPLSYAPPPRPPCHGCIETTSHPALSLSIQRLLDNLHKRHGGISRARHSHHQRAVRDDPRSPLTQNFALVLWWSKPIPTSFTPTAPRYSGYRPTPIADLRSVYCLPAAPGAPLYDPWTCNPTVQPLPPRSLQNQPSGNRPFKTTSRIHPHRLPLHLQTFTTRVVNLLSKTGAIARPRRDLPQASVPT